MVTFTHASSDCPNDPPGLFRRIWNGIRGNGAERQAEQIRDFIAANETKWISIEYSDPDGGAYRVRARARVDGDQIVLRGFESRNKSAPVETIRIPLSSASRASLIGDGGVAMTIAEIQEHIPKVELVRVTNIYNEVFEGVAVLDNGNPRGLKIVADKSCVGDQACRNMDTYFVPANEVMKIRKISKRTPIAYSSELHEFKQDGKVFLGHIIMDSDGGPLFTIQNGVEHIEVMAQDGVIKMYAVSSLGSDVKVSLPAGKATKLKPGAPIQQTKANQPDEKPYVREEEPQRAKFRTKVFRGDATHRNPGNVDGKFAVKYVKRGSNDGGYVVYNLADREYAIKAGLLYEGMSIDQLPKGRRYSYVILENGTQVFGHVDNGFEFGVKHGHLANGRPVFVAGEVDIDATGNITYNLLSGTFTEKIIANSKKGTHAETENLRTKVKYIFGSETKNQVQYTDEVLLSKELPDGDLKRRYCLFPEFLKDNKHWCK